MSYVEKDSELNKEIVKEATLSNVNWTAEQEREGKPHQKSNVTEGSDESDVDSDSELYKEIVKAAATPHVKWTKEQERQGKPYQKSKLTVGIANLTARLKDLPDTSRDWNDFIRTPSFEEGLATLYGMVADGSAEMEIFAAKTIDGECACVDQK